MTAEEIRTEYLLAKDRNFVHDSGFRPTLLLMVAEIAAQLAELNEHFRKVDNAVFGK